MDKHEAAKNRKADFCFCASAMAPHADAEALRTMVDWLNWVRNKILRQPKMVRHRLTWMIRSFTLTTTLTRVNLTETQ